jgi:hypothetical protein
MYAVNICLTFSLTYKSHDGLFQDPIEVEYQTNAKNIKTL